MRAPPACGVRARHHCTRAGARDAPPPRLQRLQKQGENRIAPLLTRAAARLKHQHGLRLGARHKTIYLDGGQTLKQAAAKRLSGVHKQRKTIDEHASRWGCEANAGPHDRGALLADAWVEPPHCDACGAPALQRRGAPALQRRGARDATPSRRAATMRATRSRLNATMHATPPSCRTATPRCAQHGHAATPRCTRRPRAAPQRPRAAPRRHDACSKATPQCHDARDATPLRLCTRRPRAWARDALAQQR